MGDKDKVKLPSVKTKHEPGSLPIEEDDFNGLEAFYPFKPDEIKALQEYQKDLDLARACTAAGISAGRKKNLLDPTTAQGLAFTKELAAIQEEYQVAIRMNANSSAKKHMELMAKFERDYDTADMKNQNKGSLASTLAKMSDSSLKATGQFANEQSGGGTKVHINIDLTTNREEEPPIDITAEEIKDV